AGKQGARFLIQVNQIFLNAGLHKQLLQLGPYFIMPLLVFFFITRLQLHRKSMLFHNLILLVDRIIYAVGIFGKLLLELFLHLSCFLWIFFHYIFCFLWIISKLIELVLWVLFFMPGSDHFPL